MTTNKKIESFDDLRIYQNARQLTRLIYEATQQPQFKSDWDLSRQIRRAAVSVGSNIAEGFERGSNKEFIQFLQIAKGSCGEIRAQLNVALDLDYISQELYKSLSEECMTLSGMIFRFIEYLKKCEFKDRNKNST